MKKIGKSIVIFVLCASINAVCYAEDNSMQMQQGMGNMKGMGGGKMQGMGGGKMQGMGGGQMQGMGGMGEMSPEKMEKKMRSMQDHMLKMHDLSNQILSEKDPKKKQALKDKQLDLMKKHMEKMKKMRMERMQNMHKMNKNMKMMQ